MSAATVPKASHVARVAWHHDSMRCSIAHVIFVLLMPPVPGYTIVPELPMQRSVGTSTFDVGYYVSVYMCGAT